MMLEVMMFVSQGLLELGIQMYMYMYEKKDFVKIEYSYINETEYIKKLQNNEHKCT